MKAVIIFFLAYRSHCGQRNEMKKIILNVSRRAKSKVNGFAELVSKMFCRSLALSLNQLSVRIKTSSIVHELVSQRRGRRVTWWRNKSALEGISKRNSKCLLCNPNIPTWMCWDCSSQPFSVRCTTTAESDELRRYLNINYTKVDARADELSMFSSDRSSLHSYFYNRVERQKLDIPTVYTFSSLLWLLIHYL